MATAAIRFNKTSLAAFVQRGIATTIKDTGVSGLKFKFGKKRSVFQFEKRISGHKGASITVTIGAFPAVSIDKARQEAYRFAGLCERGIDPRKQNTEKVFISLHETLERFFELKKEIGERTLKDYRQTVRCYFPMNWMEKDIRAITPEMLVKQFHVVRTRGQKVCWAFLKLFNNLWNSCVPLYRDEKNESLLRYNPIPEARIMLKSVRRPQPKRLVIPLHSLGKFVITLENLRCPDHWLRIEESESSSRGIRSMSNIALLCLLTAFRFREAQHLKWEYVDIDQGFIRLPGQTSSGNGEFEGTKNRHDHFVPLSTYAWDLLRKIHQERDSCSPFVFPAKRTPSQPVGRNGRALTYISDQVACHFTPHASRRTFATIADDVGLGFLTVKRMLNHTFQGGVTGGYVIPGFNPSKERGNFQKVCDYILLRRAEFLGEVKRKTHGDDTQQAIEKLKRYVLELGLDPKEALESLAGDQSAVA